MTGAPHVVHRKMYGIQRSAYGVYHIHYKAYSNQCTADVVLMDIVLD